MGMAQNIQVFQNLFKYVDQVYSVDFYKHQYTYSICCD